MSFNFLSPFSSLSFHVFRYVLLFLTHSTLIKSTCYFPDGTPSEDIPCYTNSSVNYCCGKDSICFENKVCLNNIGTFARGSCTDKAWNSPTCPVFCISGSADRGSQMIACPPLSSGTWCCGASQDDCCNTPSNLLTLGQASIVSSQPSTSTAAGSLSASTTVDSPASISSPTSGALRSASTATGSGTTTSTSIPVSSLGLSDSAKVGIGIGVPLGAIIIAMVVYLLYLHKQRHANTQNYAVEGKDHRHEVMPNGFEQQPILAEHHEQNRTPHELTSESPFASDTPFHQP